MPSLVRLTTLAGPLRLAEGRPIAPMLAEGRMPSLARLTALADPLRVAETRIPKSRMTGI